MDIRDVGTSGDGGCGDIGPRETVDVAGYVSRRNVRYWVVVWGYSKSNVLSLVSLDEECEIVPNVRGWKSIPH